MFKAGILYKKNLEATADVVVNQGGTSSSKTYSILQVLFSLLAASSNQVATVVGQDVPNLKVGALRDAKEIHQQSSVLQSLISSYNSSDRIFTFNNGSILEFKSYGNSQDAKSGKRDYLFVNEANGIPKPIYDELALRTRKRIFIDYNPNEQFWVHEKIIPNKNTVLFISDHRHNPFLPQKMRDKIEALKEEDYELWKVYARGLTGKIEGLIFPNCRIVPCIPADCKPIGLGMDFGFTNDPTACLAAYMQNGELWVDELIYETGLTNPDIYSRLMECRYERYVEIVADSAEPKSIEELKRMGLYITPAPKGPDSIKAGIDILKRYRINITARSVRFIKEQKSYKWAVDKDGQALNVPVDRFNHGWDALRYLALKKLTNKPKRELHIG